MITDILTDDFIEFLLNGPVYSNKEIAIIEENRKAKIDIDNLNLLAK